jgi:hypothetical protein
MSKRIREMYKKLMVILISLSLPLNSYATDCSVSVKLLEEGTPAPCRGFLFDPKKELEVRMMKKESELLQIETETLNLMVDKYKKKEVEFNKIIDLQSEKTELWKVKAEDITLRYVAVEESRTKRDFMFILMGVGLTVLAGWSMGQASGR